MSSRFSCNSQAFAWELQENLEDMFLVLLLVSDAQGDAPLIMFMIIHLFVDNISFLQSAVYSYEKGAVWLHEPHEFGPYNGAYSFDVYAQYIVINLHRFGRGSIYMCVGRFGTELKRHFLSGENLPTSRSCFKLY